MGKNVDEPDDFAVDGAGDAVLQFEVHLGNGIFGKDGGVGDVTCLNVGSFSVREIVPVFWKKLNAKPFGSGRNMGVEEKKRTDCGRLNHIANGESLDCLVLGCTSRAVGASNRLHMASSFLVTAAVDIPHTTNQSFFFFLFSPSPSY